MLTWLVDWSKTRWPWALLFLSAFSLVCAALYFQHVQDYLPCIKCIYQRTAVVGIVFAALLPLISTHLSMRIIALLLWAIAAWQGLVVANEQVEVIYSDSIFMPPCPIVPNFPDFLPLHEFIPSVFAGPGDCADNSWQFLSLGMAEWMRLIFISYLFVALSVIFSYLVKYKEIK